MLPGDMLGGVSAARAADLKVGAGVLTTFKQRVDKLLSEFEGSAGSPTKVDGQRVSRTSLSGTGTFHEADALHAQYEAVHGRITQLSRTLSLQIEAMGIAARGAEVGYDNLEEEERRRFWQIQAKIDHEHEAAAQRDKPGADQRGENNARKATGGYQ